MFLFLGGENDHNDVVDVDIVLVRVLRHRLAVSKQKNDGRKQVAFRALLEGKHDSRLFFFGTNLWVTLELQK